jgi:hypothetical protein
LAYLTTFEKTKVRLWYHPEVCVSVYVRLAYVNWMPELIFMKISMCIMAPEHISAAYFINPSHQSVCLHVYPAIVAR